ncbi:hypothetical protein HDU97_000623 [Phlyctochytrium planicorne]|nr:hypothetical protein HDU97_000623 [Phlyctochytrium planicorne]
MTSVAAAVWTPLAAWWNLGVIGAIVYLSQQRAYLDATALFDVTTASQYLALKSTACVNTQYRSLDGSCTDLNNKAMGMVGVSFGRNVGGTGVRGLGNVPDAEIVNGGANVRQVARLLLGKNGGKGKMATSINMLAVAHIQFQTHDWFFHQTATVANPGPSGPIVVPLPADDPLRLASGSTSIKVARTLNTKNKVSHWWDLSQIYGMTADVAASVRSFSGGKLKLDPVTGRLPIGRNGIDITGFNENWWAGLSLMHNIWTREHNSIAAMLATNNPTWRDEQIFQVARLINCALNAKVHTVEWTPALLQNDFLRVGMHVNWFGKVPSFLDPLVPAALRPAIVGLVGGPTIFDNANFTLTEEFVSVYRMHSLLPDTITTRSRKTNATKSTYNMARLAFQGSNTFMATEGIDDALFTFGTSFAGALTLNNFPNFLTNLITPAGILDVSMLDLVRDRERGVPRYKEFRQRLAMTVPNSIKDISDDPATVAAIEAVYGVDGIDDVDLLVGCLAESPRPPGYAFGETAFTLFLLMASRRLKTDRFFTTDFTPAVYTQAGIDWVQNSSMIDVIKRNFPEVAASAESVDNVFKPWKFGGAPVSREYAILANA